MSNSPMGYALPTSVKVRLKELSRTDWRVPVLIALLDHILIILLGVCGYAAWARLSIPTALLVTTVIYVVQARCFRGLENLVHDGSHYNWIRSRRSANDILTNVMAAWPVFVSVREYRASHMRHHNDFGGPTDPDSIRYWQLAVNGLDRGSLLSFVVGIGWRMRGYVSSWWRAAGTNPCVVLRGMGWHLAATSAASCAFPVRQVAWIWVAFWVLPFLTVLPFLRFVAETGKHDYNKSTVFDATISNIGIVHRLLFHPHGDGYHVLHHLFAAVPQYRLSRLHRLLVQADSERYGRDAHARTRVLQQPGQR